MNRVLSIFILSFILAGLISCRASKKIKVEVYDMQICIEHEAGDAYCNNTLSEQIIRYDEKEWEQLRPGRISVSTEDYLNQRKFIEEICLKAECSVVLKKILKNTNNLEMEILNRTNVKLIGHE